MEILKKINLKKFIAISFPTTIAFLLFSKNNTEAVIILSLYAVTMVNLLMLTQGVYELTTPDRKPSKIKVFILFFGKLILLAGGLTCGVQTMGNRIIIPILNYTIQIFVYIICFRKTK